MNKTYKVVFNRARGVLMVANEITTSVQKKGTKTVVAAAVASLLSCGVAVAADPDNYTQTGGNTGFASTTAQETSKTYEGTLNMSITGDNTRAYGLLASGDKHQFVNKGTINVNTAEEGSPFWQVKGMMADQNGTAINEGTINATNAYGMTVGSSGQTNTIINKGTISVNGGAGMEVAPTGSTGTTGTAKAVATNEGTINVTNGTGILVAGKDGVVTNNNIINAAGQVAVKVQTETGKETNGNKVVFGAKSSTTGNVEVDKNAKNTTLEFVDGAKFQGRIKVASPGSNEKPEKGIGEGNSIVGTLNVSNQVLKEDNLAGSVIFHKDVKGALTFTNSHFTNNSVEGGTAAGGAVYSYGAPFTMDGGEFVGNKALSNGSGWDSEFGAVRDGAAGGAVMMKGTDKTVFTDVLFKDNSAVATQADEQGGYAYGGALMVDYSTGAETGTERGTDLELHLTQDMLYSGNTVSSASTATKFDTYGYFVPTAAAGGFMFLDRGSVAKFNIDSAKTLTIGETITNDDTDSIASSIPNQGTTNNEGAHANVIKSGSGNLVINSSLNKYYGTVEVGAGQMTVNSAWDIKNAVTVDAGATLALGEFTLVDANAEGNVNQNVDGEKVGGSLTINGTLETASKNIFTQALDAEATVTDADKLKEDGITFNEGSRLALNDAKYNLDYAASAGKLINNGTVVMLGDIVTKDGELDGEQTLEDLKDVGPNTILNKAEVTTDGKDLVIGDTASAEAARQESLGVGSVDLGAADAVTVTNGKTLTLVGVDGSFVNSTAKDVTVTAKDGATLVLGGEGTEGGEMTAKVEVAKDSSVQVTGDAEFVLHNVNVAEGATVDVDGAATATVKTLTGAGTVNVGNNDARADLTVESLEGMTGMIFVDPAWKDGGMIADASYLSVGNVGEALTAQVVAGQNSVIGINGTAQEATSAFTKIAQAQGLVWGKDGVTAALYVGAPLKIGAEGGLLVDGSLTEAPTSITVGALTVNANGMLIADQAMEGPVVAEGKVVMAENSYLGIVNATEGSFELVANGEDLTNNGAQVVTDNPFIEGAIGADGKVSTTLNEESGLGAIASTGIQAMTRRADFMMSETIADRTSFDQDLAAGTNLWVSVTGERYDVDHMGDLGQFKADMGYGAFGAEFALTDTVVAGAAFQYGKGSLRSDVSNIKNDIANYGITAYATKSFGAAKVVGEVSYLQSENDITASQAALNQSVDAKIYSAGIRAQYQIKTDNFQFVPSIGVRVSKLESDAMTVGNVRVDDQDQTLVQVPIALRVNGAQQNAAGWALAPSFKVAFVPTFGDKEISVLSHEQDVIDTTPVQADFGLRATKGNMMLDANFMVGGGEGGTSSVGGKLGMKYVF